MLFPFPARAGVRVTGEGKGGERRSFLPFSSSPVRLLVAWVVVVGGGACAHSSGKRKSKSWGPKRALCRARLACALDPYKISSFPL